MREVRGEDQAKSLCSLPDCFCVQTPARTDHAGSKYCVLMRMQATLAPFQLMPTIRFPDYTLLGRRNWCWNGHSSHLEDQKRVPRSFDVHVHCCAGSQSL